MIDFILCRKCESSAQMCSESVGACLKRTHPMYSASHSRVLKQWWRCSYWLDIKAQEGVKIRIVIKECQVLPRLGLLTSMLCCVAASRTPSSGYENRSVVI